MKRHYGYGVLLFAGVFCVAVGASGGIHALDSAWLAAGAVCMGIANSIGGPR